MNGLSSRFNTSRAYLVGIGRYAALPELLTPADDVRALAGVLALHEFEPANIRCEIDTSRASFEAFISGMQATIEDGDRVIFYFAGHGMARETGSGLSGYICPADASRTDIQTHIPMSWLLEQFSTLKCRHLLIILDCCFAGSIQWATRFRATYDTFVKKIFREKFDRYVSDQAWQILTSSAYDEKAVDELLNLGARDSIVTGSNSPFARVLIEALSPMDPISPLYSEGIITTLRLYEYIDTHLDQLLQSANIGHTQSPMYISMAEHKKGQFIFLTPAPGQDFVGQLAPREFKNPYKGLFSYTAEDSFLYFGRKRTIQRLFQLVSDPKRKSVLLSGASGVGKTSMVQAGLLPLMQQTHPNPPLIFRPGSVKDDPEILAKLLSTAKQYTAPYVLFVDQCEELVTICTGREQAAIEDFIGQVFEDMYATIIFSVRSDLEASLSDLKFYRAAARNRVILQPILRQDIKEIILQPAAQCMVQFVSNGGTPEDNEIFINGIIDEAANSHGSLPLLSFTLQQWFEKSVAENDATWVLHEREYLELGGINGALSNMMDRYYQHLSTDLEIATLKNLLLRMTAVTNEVDLSRKKIYLDELQFRHPAQTKTVRKILSDLATHKIIFTNTEIHGVAPGDGADTTPGLERIYFEPAHDSLVNAWPQMRKWLKEEGARSIEIREQLIDAIRKWKENPQDTGLLWNDRPELRHLRQQFENIPAINIPLRDAPASVLNMLSFGRYPPIAEKPDHNFTQDEAGFIGHSIHKVRRAKGRVHLLVTGIVMLVGVAIFYLQKLVAEEKLSNARLLTTVATHISSNQNNKAMEHLSFAWKMLPSSDSLLRASILQTWRKRSVNPYYFLHEVIDSLVYPGFDFARNYPIRNDTGAVTGVHILTDTVIVTINFLDWKIDTSRIPIPFYRHGDNRERSIYYAPKQNRFIGVYEGDSSVHLFQPRGNVQTLKLPAANGDEAMQFAMDMQLAVQISKNVVRILDLKDGETRVLPLKNPDVALLSADRNYIFLVKQQRLSVLDFNGTVLHSVQLQGPAFRPAEVTSANFHPHASAVTLSSATSGWNQRIYNKSGKLIFNRGTSKMIRYRKDHFLVFDEKYSFEKIDFSGKNTGKIFARMETDNAYSLGRIKDTTYLFDEQDQKITPLPFFDYNGLINHHNLRASLYLANSQLILLKDRFRGNSNDTVFLVTLNSHYPIPLTTDFDTFYPFTSGHKNYLVAIDANKAVLKVKVWDLHHVLSMANGRKLHVIPEQIMRYWDTCHAWTRSMLP